MSESAHQQETNTPTLDKGKGKAVEEPQDVSMGEGEDTSEDEVDEVSCHMFLNTQGT